MTFIEFIYCVEGYERGERRDLEKRAWELAHHLNLWSKRRIKPGELLGDKKQAAPVFLDNEAFKRHMRQRIAHAEKKEG